MKLLRVSNVEDSSKGVEGISESPKPEANSPPGYTTGKRRKYGRPRHEAYARVMCAIAEGSSREAIIARFQSEVRRGLLCTWWDEAHGRVKKYNPRGIAPHIKRPNPMLQKAILLYKLGVHVRVIGKLAGVRQESVCRWMREQGVPRRRQGRPTGENVPKMEVPNDSSIH